MKLKKLQVKILQPKPSKPAQAGSGEKIAQGPVCIPAV